MKNLIILTTCNTYTSKMMQTEPKFFINLTDKN